MKNCRNTGAPSLDARIPCPQRQRPWIRKPLFIHRAGGQGNEKPMRMVTGELAAGIFVSVRQCSPPAESLPRAAGFYARGVIRLLRAGNHTRDKIRIRWHSAPGALQRSRHRLSNVDITREISRYETSEVSGCGCAVHVRHGSVRATWNGPKVGTCSPYHERAERYAQQWHFSHAGMEHGPASRE